MELINAYEEAQRLLNATKQTSPPIDINKIANYLKLNVYNNDFISTNPSFKNVSGFLYSDDNTPASIWLDVNDSSTRKRFTTAHEIGHFLQHSSEEKMSYVEYRNKDYYSTQDRFERNANEFAANILVSRDMLIDVISTTPFPTIDELASRFNVSRLSMGIRLKELNLAGKVFG